MASKPEGAERLVKDTTALYRSMVDLVIENGTQPKTKQEYQVWLKAQNDEDA